jgi:tetratricopeptide (TPR) repeat protein
VIAPLALSLVLAQLGPDACAPVVPLPRDPASAAAYLAIAGEERAAGRADSATAAYRTALALDPSGTGAATSLAELCQAQRREDDFNVGLAMMRAGHCPAAVAPLHAARALGDRAAALLEGICLYRAGEDAQAEDALREAEGDPDTRASARLFLGLLLLRRGQTAEASPLLDSAASDPLLAPLARGLSRDARRAGRLVFSTLTEVGWDSNVDETPGTSLTPSGAGDAFARATGTVTAAPWGERGPYARASASWRGESEEQSLDLLGGGAALGAQLGEARRSLLLEYAWDGRRLGGRPYLSANRLLAEGRLGLGPAWSAGASYALRGEAFRGDVSDYSGVFQTSQLDVTTALGGWARLTAALQGSLDRARQTPLSYRELGPLLQAAVSFGSRTRLSLEAAYTRRIYDADDPGLGVRRADGYLDGAARLEVDLSACWTAQLAVAARRASSSAPELRYARVVPTLGLGWTYGVP